MLNDSTFVPTLIEAGHSIRIEDGDGTEVQSLGGAVWITQEGDQRDVILHPGESFTLDRNGLTLLVALEEPAIARIVGPADRAILRDLVAVGVVNASCATPKSTRREALAA